MLSHLDINGNFYADPVMVNNLVFTRLGHSVKVVTAALDELAEVGLIVIYKVDGDIYLKYPDFQEKQPSLHPAREGVPDIPDLDNESLMINSCVTHTQIKVKESKVKEKKRKETLRQKEGFEEFWQAYPRKVNKREAQDKWNKKENLPDLKIILTAIEQQKQTEQWHEAGGKYIPHPTTWLNQERWTDEVKIETGKGVTMEKEKSPYLICQYCKSEYLKGQTIDWKGKQICPKCPEAREAEKEGMNKLNGLLGKIGG
jgi:hypothetical protein